MQSPPRFAAAAVLLIVACAVLSGCFLDSRPQGHVPDIIAAAVSDSVGTGQSLALRIHWAAANCCEGVLDWSIRGINDSTYELTTQVGGADDCACAPTELEHVFSIRDPPATRFHLRLVSPAETLDIPIQGGVAPAAVKRYRVELVDWTTNAPVPDILVRWIRYATIYASSGDTLAEIRTDVNGVAEISTECDSLSTQPYQIEIDKPGITYGKIFENYPGTCGLPERMVVRVD